MTAWDAIRTKMAVNRKQMLAGAKYPLALQENRSRRQSLVVSGGKAVADAAYNLVVVTPACMRPSALARSPVAGKCVPTFPRPKTGMLT